MHAQDFFDQFEVTSESASVKGVYDSTYIKDEPALVKNVYGKGRVYSFGSTFSEDTAAGLLKMLGVSEPYEEYLDIPSECELAVRSDGTSTWMFVLNYDKSEATLNLKKEMLDVLNGGSVHGTYKLPEYGIAVFEV